MTTVWKCDLSKSLVHELPMGAKALHVDYQDGNICIWFFCDPKHRLMRRAILVCGTGWTLPEFIGESHYVGSCRKVGFGSETWHIFDMGYLDSFKPVERRAIELIYDQNGGPNAEEN